jgi:hypothetical protein
MDKREFKVIITGCDMTYQGERYHGDLWASTTLYVFNPVFDPSTLQMKKLQDIRSEKCLEVFDHADTWERRAVFIVPKQDAELNATAKEYIGASQ